MKRTPRILTTLEDARVFAKYYAYLARRQFWQIYSVPGGFSVTMSRKKADALPRAVCVERYDKEFLTAFFSI